MIITKSDTSNETLLIYGLLDILEHKADYELNSVEKYKKSMRII